MDRKGRNFSYKDFSCSDSYHTNFAKSCFFGNNFFKAKMKYCCCNGCKFSFIEFKSVKFNGSHFKGAIFENVWFNNCKLYKTDIKNAKKIDLSLIISTDKIPKFDLSEDLLQAVNACRKNKYILKSETLFNKKGSINFINIFRLLKIYSCETLASGLLSAANSINKDFYSLSYFRPYFK